MKKIFYFFLYAKYCIISVDRRYTYMFFPSTLTFGNDIKYIKTKHYVLFEFIHNNNFILYQIKFHRKFSQKVSNTMDRNHK
jgi:hypothetical protein